MEKNLYNFPISDFNSMRACADYLFDGHEDYFGDNEPYAEGEPNYHKVVNLLFKMDAHMIEKEGKVWLTPKQYYFACQIIKWFNENVGRQMRRIYLAKWENFRKCI